MDPVSAVIEAIAESAGQLPEEVTLDSRLAEDLGLDSLEFVELLHALEESYGIKISSRDAVHFETAGDLARYIRSRTVGSTLA